MWVCVGVWVWVVCVGCVGVRGCAWGVWVCGGVWGVCGACVGRVGVSVCVGVYAFVRASLPCVFAYVRACVRVSMYVHVSCTCLYLGRFTCMCVLYVACMRAGVYFITIISCDMSVDIGWSHKRVDIIILRYTRVIYCQNAPKSNIG